MLQWPIIFQFRSVACSENANSDFEVMQRCILPVIYYMMNKMLYHIHNHVIWCVGLDAAHSPVVDPHEIFGLVGAVKFCNKFGTGDSTSHEH